MNEIIPLKDYVIVKELKKEMTESGLILPEKGNTNPEERIVEVLNLGDKITLPIKIGDKVLIKHYGFDEIVINHIPVLIGKEENVVAIFR